MRMRPHLATLLVAAACTVRGGAKSHTEAWSVQQDGRTFHPLVQQNSEGFGEVGKLRRSIANFLCRLRGGSDGGDSAAGNLAGAGENLPLLGAKSGGKEAGSSILDDIPPPGRLSMRESQALAVRMRAKRGESLFQDAGSALKALPSRRLESLKEALTRSDAGRSVAGSVSRGTLEKDNGEGLSSGRSGTGLGIFVEDSKATEDKKGATIQTPSAAKEIQGLGSARTPSNRRKELMQLLEDLESKLDDPQEKDLSGKDSVAEVGEEEDDREEDDEKIERQESKSDDDEDIDDIGIEQDDFDYEETVERVKEHFLSQKQDDGASAASKNDGGDESDLLEGFKGDSGAWSGSRLGKDESMLESEFDWESLPEAELRKHVRKILGRNDVGKFDGSRSLHPDLYELMTAAGPLTEQQAALNVELRTAVKDGNIEEVEKLIKEGADVSKAMPDHIIPDEDVESNLLCMVWPPLHWAAAMDHTEIIKLLVRKGADPNARDSMTSEGRYLYDSQIPGGEEVDDETSRKEWNLNYNMTALHWATHHANGDSVKMLCDLGADVTLEDFRNRTAIEIAAYRRLCPEERPFYDECLKHLKIRLIEQVGKKSWVKYWPNLLNETYLESMNPPDIETEDDFHKMDESWRRYFRLGEFALKDDEPVDLDQLLREAEAEDDPTVRKNEYVDYRERDPENQFIDCYVPGKPFMVQ